MKKFLYFFGILALIAGLVSSCSKDEDDEGNGNSLKRLVKVTGDNFWYEYKYDNDGRCISEHYYDEGEFMSYALCTYEGDKAFIKEYDSDGTFFGTTTVFFNSKGFVTSWEIDFEERTNRIKTVYTYNEDDQLISSYFTEDDSEERLTIYKWENGNLVKKDNTTISYTNSQHTSPVENKLRIDPEHFDYPICNNYGVSSKYFPINDGYDELEWTLDEDGYPIKRVAITSDGDKYTRIYTWE